MRHALDEIPFGQMNATVKKLGGKEGLERFLRGELVVRERVPTKHVDWKTVTLGLYTSAEAYRHALKHAVDKHGDRFLDFISFCGEQTEVNLSLLSVRSLGFDDAATYEDICMKAVATGLYLCPAEAGPALQLQYPEEPGSGWLLIGMDPVRCDVNGGNHILRIGAHGNWPNRLTTQRANPNDEFVGDDRFVFARSQ